MRRSRIQVKPNIGAVVAAANSLDESKTNLKSDVNPAAAAIESAHSIIKDVPSTSSDSPDTAIPAATIQPIPLIHVETSNTENNDHVFLPPFPRKPDIGHIGSPRPRLISSSSAAHDGGAASSPRTRLLSTCSEVFGHHKKERRKFTGDEQLDPKTMRMSDLITWNPKKEKKLDRTKLDNCETRSEMEREDERPAAPQLKLDANGKLVVDETSLLLDERSTNSVWQVVEEDRAIRKVNSSSFRRWRKGIPWSEKETEFFYEVLRSTGPDFGLMHDFFPRRSRNELKNKYNREERFNWERLKSVLAKPITLEETLYKRADYMALELNKEESEKMEAKMTKKKKNGSKVDPTEEEGWDEEKADLEKEAEDIINELIAVDKRKEEIAKIKKEEKKRRADEKRKISKEAAAILDETVHIVKKKKNEDNKKMEKVKKEEKKKKVVATEANVMSGYPEMDDFEGDAKP